MKKNDLIYPAVLLILLVAINHLPKGVIAFSFTNGAAETFLISVEYTDHNYLDIAICENECRPEGENVNIRNKVATSFSGNELKKDVTASKQNNEDSAQEHRLAARSRSFYADLSYQAGNIQGYALGLGYSFSNILVALAYSNSSDSYVSPYFTDSELSYSLQFHGLFVCTGYNLVFLRGNDFGAFLTPSLHIGGEFLKNNDLFANENIDYLLNYVIKPHVSLGFFYRQVDLYIGANYYHWLLTTMTNKRIGLYDADSQEPIIWADDLFVGRQGLQVHLGIRINF